MKEFLKKYKFIILGLIIVFSILFIVVIYIFYVWNELIVRDINYEEYKTCISSPEIKSSRDIKITEKGVCFQHGLCQNLNDFECKNFTKSLDRPNDFYWGWTVVDGLNKNNFDFDIIKKNENERIYFYKMVFNDQEKFYAMDVFNHWHFLLNWKTYFIVNNVDMETFEYLGGKYSKDKNRVYYKNEIIDADPETFIYEKGKGKAIGKGRDKNGTWIKGVLK